MKSRSCKAKGRRCVQEVVELFLKLFSKFRPDDFLVHTSSVPGRDLQVSPLVSEDFPFAIECKNTEHLNIWKALEQAESHVNKQGEIPVLFFKRNRSRLYVALDAESFLKGWKK